MTKGPHQAASQDATLAAEAAALLLRARRDVTACAEARAWAARSQRHAQVWEAARRLQAASCAQREAVKRQRVRRRRRALSVASTVAMVLLAVLAWPSLQEAWRGDLRSATGEIRVARLEDGSTVVLDAGSTLVPAGSNGERGGTLRRGRAYFEVVQDARRPFRIRADALEVTAIGTAFSVEKFDRATEVALDHGSVEVRAAGQRLRLQTGQRLRLEGDGRLSRSQVAPAAIGAWRHGQLALQDAAIADMVAALRPHFRGLIVVSDASWSSGRRITGVFDLRDPARALRAAVTPFGGRVRQLSPWVLLVSGPA